MLQSSGNSGGSPSFYQGHNLGKLCGPRAAQSQKNEFVQEDKIHEERETDRSELVEEWSNQNGIYSHQHQ